MGRRSDNFDFYKREPNFYAEDKLYIHIHKRNVGRMGGNTAKSDNELASIFSNYKEGKDSIVQKAVTNQYAQAVRKSINDSRTHSDFLNEVFDSKNDVTGILDQLHKVMQEGLEQYINTDNLVKLLQNEKKLKWSPSYKTIQDLDKALSTQTGSYKDDLKALDILLQSMADTVALIESPLGVELATALLASENKTNNFTSIKKYGSNLQRVLNDFKQKNNAILINQPLMQEAIDNLENIIKPLATLQLQKNDGTTSKTTLGKLQGRVTQNFFPNLAEILAAQIQDVAVKGAIKMHQNARRTGAETSQIQITDTEGNYFNAGFFDDGGKKQDKADNIYENVRLRLDSLRDGEQGYIRINIGISSKSYVSQHFGKDTSLADFNDVYSLGGGMTVGNAFRLLLGDINSNVYVKYLGYNILSHDANDSGETGGFPEGLQALQDVLLTRSIVYMVAGRNKQNIAQFMMINGNLLSVWDIIKYALNNNIGQSSSQISNNPNARPGIYMSIEKRKDVIAYAKSRDWVKRIVDTNDAINSSTMKAHLIPKQIINYIETNNIKI